MKSVPGRFASDVLVDVPIFRAFAIGAMQVAGVIRPRAHVSRTASPRELRRGFLVTLLFAAAVLAFHGSAFAQGDAQSHPTVIVETTLGDITMELYPERSPVTVENFLRYVKTGFYTGTIFHRVIENFMIQGGGYTKERNQKMPLYPPIKLEARNGLKNLRGTLSMARTRAPDSGTCQFFINVVDNPFLDYSETTNPIGYAVFGRVIQGMDVVDRIRAVKVGENPLDLQQDGRPATSLPATPVVIEAIRLLEPGTSTGKRTEH